MDIIAHGKKSLFRGERQNLIAAKRGAERCGFLLMASFVGRINGKEMVVIRNPSMSKIMLEAIIFDGCLGALADRMGLGKRRMRSLMVYLWPERYKEKIIFESTDDLIADLACQGYIDHPERKRSKRKSVQIA